MNHVHRHNLTFEAVSQLILTLKIIVLFGFKALFGLLHHSVLNCWTASMVREDPDGTKTPLTMPNHERIKGSTLRVICRQAGIKREDFLTVYERI